MNYLVSWYLDTDSESPEEAAWFARECMTRSDTTATTFEVTDENGVTVIINLVENTDDF